MTKKDANGILDGMYKKEMNAKYILCSFLIDVRLPFSYDSAYTLLDKSALIFLNNE